MANTYISEHLFILDYVPDVKIWKGWKLGSCTDEIWHLDFVRLG